MRVRMPGHKDRTWKFFESVVGKVQQFEGRKPGKNVGQLLKPIAVADQLFQIEKIPKYVPELIQPVCR